MIILPVEFGKGSGIQGNGFGRNTEPHFVAQLDPFIKPAKHVIPAVPVLANVLGHVRRDRISSGSFPFHGCDV